MGDHVLLEAKGLTKTFGSRTVVDRLDLRIEKGDIYGFLGTNGSGKTTTIRMLTGLVHPDAGEVRIGGFHLKTRFKDAIAHVGAIVESPAFYAYLSAYDNLKLTANLLPGVTRTKVDEVLEIAGLSDRAKDKVGSYSLGMKQRLGIAGALLNRPQLIILDEPTNGLDPQGMKEIKELIAQLAAEQNISFLISSHLLHEVEQICNRAGVIRKGKLIAEVEVGQLLAAGPETVEIVTPEPDKAEQLVTTVPEVISVSRSQGKLVVQTDSDCSYKLNQLLVASGVTIRSISCRPRTLEQFFFDITEGDGGQ
ncbi:ABC transporter ATP-binding protein [Paenibacillus sp. XY044]|uniref:ABC transporter ATP-binding protein n=1 Tax=Paenibacillus sp. XY044 TaxID=2026089 RepID=UPI000B99127C|nr:ABC transporter ATP-binding protein [Paenibacillus sp. XY044]OZB96570.1 ABC transporter ATP-binding protein [Paenibacillus sp. XY044]